MSLEERLIATSGRGPGFDLIRLAAAAVVLLHHCRLTQYDINDPLFIYSGGFMHFGLLAVIVFFAISGFLVTPGLERSGDIVGFCINRTLRIFPALVVVVVATMLLLGPMLTALSYLGYFSDPRTYLYLKNALTLTYDYLPGVASERGDLVVVNGALWTLHFEVLAYGALAIMSVMGLLRRRTLLLATLILLYAVYLIISFSPAAADYLPRRFVVFLTLFIYFAAGSALFVFRDHVPFSGSLALGALAILLIALPAGWGPALLPLGLPYITTFCGLSVLPGQSLVKRDLSYGVYLIHAPMVVAIGALFPNVTNWLLLAFLVSIVTGAMSYLCRTFIEEPALRQKKALSRWINSQIAVIKG